MFIVLITKNMHFDKSDKDSFVRRENKKANG